MSRIYKYKSRGARLPHTDGGQGVLRNRWGGGFGGVDPFFALFLSYRGRLETWGNTRVERYVLGLSFSLYPSMSPSSSSCCSSNSDPLSLLSIPSSTYEVSTSGLLRIKDAYSHRRHYSLRYKVCFVYYWKLYEGHKKQIFIWPELKITCIINRIPSSPSCISGRYTFAILLVSAKDA